MLQLRNQLIFFNDGAAEIIYTVKQTFFYVMLTKHLIWKRNKTCYLQYGNNKQQKKLAETERTRRKLSYNGLPPPPPPSISTRTSSPP